jgi:hypothetical protein
MSYVDTQATLLHREVALTAEVSLCVDLDGTLVRSDLLVESWFTAGSGA